MSFVLGLGLGIAVLMVAPVHAAAQVQSRWFPDVEPFQPLIAAPREVQVRASLVYADRPELESGEALYDGRNVEAEVAVGHRLEIYRFDDGSSPGKAVTIGIEMGIFSRFFMEAREKDLISSDFRIGFPFSVRSGAWESRITLRHVSSHLGDDYFDRFPGALFGQTSKDGFEGLLARRFGEGIRVYAGGDANFHTNDEMSRTVVRFGGEWEAVDPGNDDGSWPVLAADVEWASFSKAWGATLVGGMAFRVNGREIRLEARARLGSTPMGYFRDADETFFGLGFALDL